MKKILISMLMIVLFSCPALAGTPEYIEGEVLVVLKTPMSAFSALDAGSANAFSEALASQADAFASEYELEVLSTFSEISSITGANIIHLRSEFQSTEELIQELSAVPYVESVSPNGIMELFETTAAETAENYAAAGVVPNDPSYSQQWNMKAIEIEDVWEYETGKDTVCVAVLDTGIDYNHPDISANMARDSSGNYGRYFNNGVETNDPMDRHGHGTHVAGIIGAVGNNGVGVAGVNWKVKMLAVNVMPNASAEDADVIKAINYVLNERRGLNIRVVNMSFGKFRSLADNSPLGMSVKSLSDAGIICSIAVGNNSENISSPTLTNLGLRVYPACFKFENNISVGSFSNGNGKSSFSNFSSEWVDIAAPGDKVYSTNFSNKYGTMDGTSMSAPHIAGAAALLMAARPSETSVQIKNRIINGAKKIGVSEGYWKYGILDAAAAYHYSSVNVPVAGVSLNKTTMQLGVTEVEALYPVITPSNASNKNVTWRSSNTAVAEVSSGGLVNARSVGNATITVTTVDGARTASCSVSVTQAGSIIHPTSVFLDKMTMTIPLGGNGILTPTIEPPNATNKEVQWLTSNPFTATVSGGVVYAGESPGTAIITVRTVDGGYSKTCTVTVTAPVTKVTLNKHETTIGIGRDELLEATVEPYNATNYNVSWSSSNEAVATVTQGGLIAGKSVGTAIITVRTIDGGYTDTCTVTVTGGAVEPPVTGPEVAVTGVTLNKTNMALSVAGSEQLMTTITPPDASNKNLSWSSSNPSVATVSDGLVTGVSAGTATITVRTEDGDKTAACSVTVSNVNVTVPVTAVTLNKTNMALSVAGSEQLTATITPPDASNKNLSWSSSNPSVATVSDGVITGVSAGTTTITVRTEDGNRTATCSVTVTNAGSTVPVNGVSLNKTSMTLNIESSEQLTATITPPDASNKSLSWGNSNPSVARVSDGLVIGVSTGTTTITVRTADGDKTAACLVTVPEPPTTVTGVTLNKKSTIIDIGGEETLFAIVTPATALNQNVYWGSDNSGVATVSSGKVTGLSAGTARITVITEDGDFKDTCTVTVGSIVPVTEIAVDKNNITIKVGNSEKLTFTVAPENATNKNLKIESDNNDVAEVTNEGVVTGKSVGVAIISAFSNDSLGTISVDCTVTVVEADTQPADNSITWVRNPTYASSKAEAASMLQDFSEDDLDVADGKVVIKKSIAEKIYRELSGDEFEPRNGVLVTPIPYFEAAVEPGKIAAVKIPMKGRKLDADDPKNINLLKILTPTTGVFLEYVYSEAEYRDGKFTVLDVEEGVPATGKFVLEGDYELVIFIRDGGSYDLDKAVNGYIVDPTAIVRRTWPGEQGIDDDEGCNAGFGGSVSLLLAGLALFTVQRKK
ncbi:MAG: Ig-like domain-containing protein [Synergistaceae bacterium]|nr:Ig-like domain-containing protein [Synergistaceae bacterium]